MKEIRKRLIAVLAALALAFSVFPLGSPAVEVKADAPEPITINTDLRGQNGDPWGGDAIHAGVFWYTFKDQIENPSEYWDVRWEQIENYGKTTDPAMFVVKQPEDPNESEYWDWDWDNEDINWDFKKTFVFDKVLVDSNYEDGWNFITKELEIASCGAITISGDHWAPMKVLQSAVIRSGGTLSITGNNEETVLEIGANATLTIEDGVVLHVGARNTIRVNETARVYLGSAPLVIDGVSFGEDREYEYDLTYDNGVWGAEEAPHIVTDVVLPRDEKSFDYTLRHYYDNKQHDSEGNELPPSFTNVTIDCPDNTYSINNGLAITNLKVTEGSTLAITTGSGTNDQGVTDYWTCSLDVNNATINGTVTLSDSTVKDKEGKDQVNHLVIYDKLTIGQNGSVVPSGNAQFELGEEWDNRGNITHKVGEISVYNMDQLKCLSRDQRKEMGVIYVYPGQKINVGGSAYRAPIGTTGVLIDGTQDACKLRYDSDKQAWVGIGRVQDLTLPADAESLQFTVDWYYNGHEVINRHDDNNDGEIDWEEHVPPTFGTITVNGNATIDQSIAAEKLIVTADSTLTLATGGETHDYWWEYEDEDGNTVRELVKDSNGAPVQVFDAWAGQLTVNEAEIAGTVEIANSDAEWYDKRLANGDPDLSAEHGPSVNFFRIDKSLKITGNGLIKTVNKSQSAKAVDGELSFGEFDASYNRLIDIPAQRAIQTTPFYINTKTKVVIDGEVYTIDVKSGNPGDEKAVHSGFKFDYDRENDNGAHVVPQEDGSWKLLDWDEINNKWVDFYVWWGAPFDNEYRVFMRGDAKETAKFKVGSTEYGNWDFVRFEAGKPIEFEIVPPAGYTGTPIVYVNSGFYNNDRDYMRTDDFLASDAWFNGIQKLTVTDNKVSYTPKDNKGVSFNIYFDPEDIMYDAIYFIDRKYLWAGGVDEKTGVWGYYNWYGKYGIDDDWELPGKEFMVEASSNGNGLIEMTHGVDFYRIGNKVKALYQGFEILDGGVEVKFTPASGYDLLAVTIDGQSYDPGAVTGMTYSGGVYTLKISETPDKPSTLVGLNDLNCRESVKIKTITANFGIRTYTNPDPDPTPVTPDPTPTDPATPTTPVTPEPEPEVIKEPEVVDTINRVTKSEDGTETTTNITKYDDGSQTTEKVVEKPDGSSTSTTTTTEADGTKVVEKVEEKADGSSKATTTTTETDGTKKTETVEKKVDGTEVKTNTVKDADGNSTTEKVEKKTDGTVTTTNTTKDADGASTTEKVVEKPDGSVTTTSTEKDADGNVLSTSKVVEKTKEDGTKTITATEKNADGSSSTSKTTINTDGSSKTNTTTQNADGSTTKEKITEKADGSLTRTATTTDEDGNVLATEKEKVTVSKSGTETSTTTIENADGSSSESVVKTKADGTASSTLTETDADGNVSVTVGSTKKDGSEISKSYAVEDDGVVLTAVEATTASASIPASVKVNGKSVPVTTVGEGAMKDNTSVKKVTLAESITSIGEDAFSGAKNLKTIKLSANVTEIAPGAFDGIKSNATFYISAETDEEFNALVELLKKSGVGSKVKFKRA